MSYRQVQRRRIGEKAHSDHTRILGRVEVTALIFGLDPQDEEAWLLEADYHRTHRLKGESLGGLLGYVRTMMGLRSRAGMSSTGLKDYHDGAHRMDPGPDHQASPVEKHEVILITSTLPFCQGVAFWLMWKTASRCEDVLNLRGEHLHFDDRYPNEFAITWLDLTKLGKKDPWSIRNTTHVVIDPSDAWQRKCFAHLKALDAAQEAHPFVSWSQMAVVLQRLPAPLNRLRTHSFKAGACDEVNRLMATKLHLPRWVGPLLLKHDNLATKMIPSQTVRYSRDKLALVRTMFTGELTACL